MIVTFEPAITTTSELVASLPLGNPAHPTGSSVQVRDVTHPTEGQDRFIVGVRRGNTWKTEITFRDLPPAQLFAAGMRAGMNWTPKP